MRLIYFGSGEFGLPTLRRLASEHDVALVVSQPDRPAGRHRALSPTPIAEFAASLRLPVLKPEIVNQSEVVRQIQEKAADAFVVIAFGQKLSPALLNETFAINLHASLLPKYRGAAPIQWAVINGERETGVSVIGLADRMDAGPIFAQASTTIDPNETAGELHDRLATLGPQAVQEVLARHAQGSIIPQYQDERLATKAPKLSKSDGTVRFDQPAADVRNRVRGLTPWPGCTIRTDGLTLRLTRVQMCDEQSQHDVPGLVLDDLSIACATGAIRLVEVQPPGGRLMSIQEYRNGHSMVAGMRFEPL